MKTYEKICGLAVIGSALAGCVEDTGTSGLRGTPTQFAAMERPCAAQASRLTGVSQSFISITDRIQTGGGPILTLSAAGTPYTCRLERNGRVTVFSEFAN